MTGSVASVSVFDVTCALAFVGDLSMGQPVDHSLRTAWLAWQVAGVAGMDAASREGAAYVALLRWSGCTANAPEFAELLGDDVNGRRDMLAMTSADETARFVASVGPAAQIHCEVSGEIARLLGLPAAVETALRCIFEWYDGTGKPKGLARDEIPATVFITSLCGDLEILSRAYGLPNALQLIAQRAGRRYPAGLVEAAVTQAAAWLDALDRGATILELAQGSSFLRGRLAAVEIIADVVDLKVPWMAGLSRNVAATALQCATNLGLDERQRTTVYRAGLIHGIGRGSVPNGAWEMPATRSESDAERLRLVPYWTERAGRRIEALREEARLASYIEERLDGSGHFRGARGAAIELEARILAVAGRYVWMQTARPGVAAMDATAALAALQHECASGQLDATVVAALAHDGVAGIPARHDAAPAPALSLRETEVLRRISLGESNKEAAKSLGISPSTVRAHLENIFRKLECSTRAAATLKAYSVGLL
jgi:HD-GYP domain-containing protein (c-di-GMP phosphodiesterase class II)/DNA-binding CsgD family transcriptional regulator